MLTYNQRLQLTVFTRKLLGFTGVDGQRLMQWCKLERNLALHELQVFLHRAELHQIRCFGVWGNQHVDGPYRNICWSRTHPFNAALQYRLATVVEASTVYEHMKIQRFIHKRNYGATAPGADTGTCWVIFGGATLAQYAGANFRRESRTRQAGIFRQNYIS